MVDVPGSDGGGGPTLESLRRSARSVYGADASGYDAGRPDYPGRVYEVLARRCGLRSGAAVLEVGPGPGTVTRRLLEAGARVVAVEPDAGMAAHLRSRLGPGVTIVAAPFEEAAVGDGRFDLAVAATSFHWVEQTAGMAKLGQVLRPGGWAALWWTIFDDPEADDPFRDELARRLGRGDPGGQGNADYQLDTAARCRDLRVGAGLGDVESEIIRWSVELDSDRLRRLYDSMIRVRSLPPAERRRTLDAVSAAAEHRGGRARRPFVTVMYTGRRPGP